MTLDEVWRRPERAMAAHLVKLQDQQLLLMIESGMSVEDASEFLHEQRARFQAEVPQILARIRQGLIDFDKPDAQQ